MARAQRMKSSNNAEVKVMDLLELPLDILINILSRLPAESLLCIRCVSKALLNMVDDPSFARVLHAHLQVPQLMLFSGRKYHPKPGGIEVLASLQPVKYDGYRALTKGQYEISVTARKIYNSEDSHYKIDFVFCNLFFLRKSWGIGRFLVNPLRGGEVLRLPMSDITKYGKYFNVTRDWYGMGFDDLTNTYKIVRVSRVFNGSYTENCLVTQVLVLGESSWREILSVPPGDLNANERSYIMKNVCANGDMHWLITGNFTMKGSEGTCHIISFDFKREEFCWTPHPILQSSKVSSDLYFNLHLLTLRGSMALVYQSASQGGTLMDIEIWVLKNYDKKEWTRDYNINNKPFDGSCHEWEHGIFFKASTYTVFLDLNCFSVNYITYEYGEYPTILSYTRSLVSLKEYGNLVEGEPSDYGSLESYGKLIEREEQGFSLSERHVLRYTSSGGC
ncbi:F-box/kelch-repeat protein At3g06240-like [Rosa rugosa]|uniref:F-box/kelch-repeat protein At3g06240-like n=1 Tax=Rosa rugosa TaxID=74645 RepID=UPI002B40C760|nr:F-box/kelch-repeat protein At3g06240-like [Rosa rugosa]